jgi:mRNA interferase RelE/StbE
MGSYQIEVLRSVDHDARKIDKKNLERIVSTIRSLTDDPFPTQCKKLSGSEKSYRIRVGDYRILYGCR